MVTQFGDGDGFKSITKMSLGNFGGANAALWGYR